MENLADEYLRLDFEENWDPAPPPPLLPLPESKHVTFQDQIDTTAPLLNPPRPLSPPHYAAPSETRRSAPSRRLASQRARSTKCSWCRGQHNVFSCPKLFGQSPEEIFHLVVKWRHCIRCLASHRQGTCDSPNVCSRCGSDRHHTLLHDVYAGPSPSPVSSIDPWERPARVAVPRFSPPTPSSKKIDPWVRSVAHSSPTASMVHLLQAPLVDVGQAPVSPVKAPAIHVAPASEDPAPGWHPLDSQNDDLEHLKSLYDPHVDLLADVFSQTVNTPLPEWRPSDSHNEDLAQLAEIYNLQKANAIRGRWRLLANPPRQPSPWSTWTEATAHGWSGPPTTVRAMGPVFRPGTGTSIPPYFPF